MIVKLLTRHHLEFVSIKRGYTGSPESTLVKIPHCRKSQVAAHLIMHLFRSVCKITSIIRFIELRCL